MGLEVLGASLMSLVMIPNFINRRRALSCFCAFFGRLSRGLQSSVHNVESVSNASSFRRSSSVYGLIFDASILLVSNFLHRFKLLVFCFFFFLCFPTMTMF